MPAFGSFIDLKITNRHFRSSDQRPTSFGNLARFTAIRRASSLSGMPNSDAAVNPCDEQQHRLHDAQVGPRHPEVIECLCVASLKPVQRDT